MSISLQIRILLIFGPPNLNTLKKLESEYIFSKLKESVNPIIIIINITVDIHKEMYTLGLRPVTESLHKQYILMIYCYITVLY